VTVGFFSISPIILSTNSFRPIIDHATSLASVCNLHDSKEMLNLLNQSSKSIRSIGESYINICNILTTITLLTVFTIKFGILDVNALTPTSLAGLLIGGMLPFKFTSMILDGVNETSMEIIEEIKS